MDATPNQSVDNNISNIEGSVELRDKANENVDDVDDDNVVVDDGVDDVDDVDARGAGVGEV